jgi:predicted amidohydrolase
MKVAGVQFDIAWEDPEANFKKVEDFVQQAVEQDVDLLVLPEMFATGFSMAAERVASHAEKTRGFLSDLSKRHDLYVMAGFAESSQGEFFNACGLYDRSGEEVLHYRKIHPFSLAKEGEFYGAGDQVVTIQIEGVRITPFICYDLRFPEIFRAAVVRTDLFCVIANWPARRSDAWSAILKARAIENQAYVLGINRVGEAGGLEHSGHSALLDPMGTEMDSKQGIEGLVGGVVSADQVKETRERFSFVADRRPDLYRKF